MRRFLMTVVAAYAGMLIPHPALAQNSKAKKPGKMPPHRQEFQRLDTNHDSKLSAEEFVDGSAGKAADNKRQQHAEFDLNDDGILDMAEFWRFLNKPPEQEWLRKDFKQRDKDKNGALTLKEYVGDKSGPSKVEARTWFFRYDTDENEQVTLEEFLDRDPKRKVSIHNQFQVHDLNDDGQLTEQEFMRTRLGKVYEQVARENFAKFDVNGDRRLSEPEFVVLPGMATQRIEIEREQRRRGWIKLGLGLAIGSGGLLLLVFVGWRYARSVASRREPVIQTEVNAPAQRHAK